MEAGGEHSEKTKKKSGFKENNFLEQFLRIDLCFQKKNKNKKFVFEN